MGNPTQLLKGAIASALVLGRHVFSRGGALAGTGISAGDALAELAAKTFVLLEEASAPLKMERKKEKRRPLDLFFVFYVMFILSLLEENDTLTS